jgi:hypothetical protein
VFRRQIQSTINEGRLMLHEMQVDKQHFPINTMELQQPRSWFDRIKLKLLRVRTWWSGKLSPI